MRSLVFSFTLSVLALCAGLAEAQSVSFRRVAGDFPVDVSPQAVAIADLNKDGHLDLAVANSDSDDVSVLWGRGDGTFLQYCSNQATQSCSTDNDCQGGTCNPPGITIPTGIEPMAIAIGDFNNDGQLDIVTADNIGNTATVLLNQGGMAFGDGISTATGNSPTAVVVGDFNGDGKLDVATANSFDDTVTVLFGTGDGNFLQYCSNQVTQPCSTDNDCQGGTCNVPSVTIPTGSEPIGLAVADLNGDKVLDLVVTNSSGGASATGTISVLIGTGTGTFLQYCSNQATQSCSTDNDCQGGTCGPPEISSTAFNVPVAVTVADVNGDGKLDLIVANEDGDSASILLGNGDGTFQGAANVDVGSSPESVVAADFNGDGKVDFATANSFDDSVSVAVGNGDGTFMPAVDFAVAPGPSGVATGDLNGDGKPDIVSANTDDDSASVLLNTSGQTVCVGDCDGSGDVSVNELITMVDIALGNLPVSSCTAGDANGDGTIEINEIITAVNNALNGCPAASPTGTPATTATPTPPTATPTPT